MHFQYIKTKNNQTYLESLCNLLDGVSHKSDEKDSWSSIVTKTAEILGNRKNEIESAELSLDGELLAICMQVRTMLGLKMRHAGFVYSKKIILSWVVLVAVSGKSMDGHRLNGSGTKFTWKIYDNLKNNFLKFFEMPEKCVA